jgi:ligand-binding sensor domain-containing protein
MVCFTWVVGHRASSVPGPTGRKKSYDFLSKRRSRRSCHGGEQHLLAATKVGGLILLDREGVIHGRFQHARADNASLISDRTTCLLRDRSGNLWVGTAKGLSVFAPSVWRSVRLYRCCRNTGKATSVFHAIQQDDDGSIRLSTSKGFILVDAADHSTRLVELTHAGAGLEMTGLFRTGRG